MTGKGQMLLPLIKETLQVGLTGFDVLNSAGTGTGFDLLAQVFITI